MRNISSLINLFIKYIPNHVKTGGCVCDVLDNMYIEMIISFQEMNFLNSFITNHVPEEIVNKAVDTSRYTSFISYLKFLTR